MQDHSFSFPLLLKSLATMNCRATVDSWQWGWWSYHVTEIMSIHLILEASMPQLLRPSRCFFVFLWLVSRLHCGQWSLWLLRENQRRGCQKVRALKELRTICFTSSFADCEEKSGEMLAGEAKKVRVSPGTLVSFRAVSTRPCVFPCHWQETAQWYPSICSINRALLGVLCSLCSI